MNVGHRLRRWSDRNGKRIEKCGQGQLTLAAAAMLLKRRMALNFILVMSWRIVFLAWFGKEQEERMILGK